VRGDGRDVRVAVSLQDSLGVRAVRLVPSDVGADLVRRQQYDLVAELLDPSSPIVSRATRLHDHGGGRQLAEEEEEPAPRKAARQPYPARFVRQCHIENYLCDIHRGNGMLLHGLLLFLLQGRLWHTMPIEAQGGV